MNLFQSTAIFAVILCASIPSDVLGNPWLARSTSSSAAPTTSPVASESPSPAILETTSIKMTKRPYPSKKTPAPEPTPAALETASVNVPPATGLALESTSLRPAVETTMVQENATTILLETPTTLRPLIESTIVPQAESSTAKPLIESTVPILHPESTPGSPPSEAPIVETAAPTLEPAPVTESPAPESTQGPIEITPAPVPEGERKTRPTQKVPTLPPISFDCKGKNDGYYADPKDKCSSIFYACVGGLGRQLECPAKSLVYEPETGACENREESFRCSGKRRTTMPSTPRRPPPPPTSLVIDCSKLDDGLYADPQKKCGHAFYSCTNGVGVRLDCPGKMYYDAHSKACQSYDEVEACSGKKPVATTPTTPRPQDNIPIKCDELASGQYPDPAKKCSNIYYVCSNGEGYKATCADGTYFDAKKQLCDFYDEVFDCVGKTKPPTKATAKPVPSPASLPSSEFDCKGKKDGSYLPESKKCSSDYYRCVAGNTFKAICPAKLVIDIKNDRCERREELVECGGKKPTTPKPVSTLKPVPTEKLPIDCSMLKDGDYPDPEKKCSSTYYTCSNYMAVRRLCARGTRFDKHYRICDAHENVPDCGGKPRPATKPTSKSPPHKISFDCEKRKDGNYASAKCASLYYSCVGGEPVVAYCAANTFYDPEYDQCGFKEDLPACGGSRPTIKP